MSTKRFCDICGEIILPYNKSAKIDLSDYDNGINDICCDCFEKMVEFIRDSKRATMAVVEFSDLSMRPYNGLRRAGLTTYQDIINLINSQHPGVNGNGLHGIRSLGPRSINEIIKHLKEHGYWELVKSEFRCGERV